MTRPHFLKMTLSTLVFALTIHYWTRFYPHSLYIDPWYPNIVGMIGIWWTVGFSLPLKQGDKLRDSEVRHWLFSTFYIGLLLMIPLYTWGNILRDHYIYIEQALDLRKTSRWGLILLSLAILYLFSLFLRSKWGMQLCQKRFFQGLSLFLMTSILLIWMLELFLRTPYSIENLIGPFPPNVVAEYAYDPRQHWGVYDMGVSNPKAPDQLRVLFVGDSYTYGVGVYPQERFAEVIRAFAPEDVEIVVLAYGGLSTYDELEAWREVGIGVQADIVVVGVVTNDPTMNLLATTPTFRPSYLYFQRLFPTSSLAYYVDTLNLLAYDNPRAEGKLTYNEWEAQLYSDPETQTLWVETVQTFYDEITATGAQAWAYILATPYHANLQDFDGLNKYERLAEVFSSAGFQTSSFLPDVLENLDAKSPKHYCAFPNDCHPNPQLHQYYAEQMWADLEPALDELRARR